MWGLKKLFSGRESSSAQQASGSSSRTQGGGWRPNPDAYTSVEDVQAALRSEGLESSNLIVAVDFTKSNEWSGKWSFGGKSLHHVSPQGLNPYESAISIIGRTLASFDDDQLIPSYGFGDALTGDQSVFSFGAGDEPCDGLDAVLSRYRELVPLVKLAGPTSFAPAIWQAMRIVQQSGGKYHILLLLADGQVTRSSDLSSGQLSTQEKETIDAVVAASQLPLSIVMVGVGDGPWDMMKEFDDALPQRAFDNFQFVNFTDISRQFARTPQILEARFALNALMEIPAQYREIQRRGMLGRRTAVRIPGPAPLDPPSAFGRMNSQRTSAGSIPQPVKQPSAGFPSAPPIAAAPASAIPSLYICPITQEPMRDPVIAADGHTYEQEAIEAWLRSHNTSPMTNAQLSNRTLTPNHGLRSAIQEHLQRTGASSGL